MARHLLRDCDAFTLVRFKQLTAKERHEAWLEHRREGLGGSDMATILGLNKYKTPYELWLEKTGREQPVGISDKWAIVKGNALEKELRNRFRALHPEWECYDGTDKSLVSRNHPFLIASLDGVLYDETRGYGVLEIKTTSAHRGKTDWHDMDGNLKIPDYYMAQVTHYLAVTGWTWGVVYADIGEAEPVEIMFERDEEDVEAIIKAASDFWTYVQDDTPPALTATDVDMVQQSTQPEGYEQVEDDEFDRLAALWHQFDEAEKSAKQQKTGISDQLKTMVGDTRQGLVSLHNQVGYKDVRFKAQPAKTIPAKDAYTQRRFYVKPLNDN